MAASVCDWKLYLNPLSFLFIAKMRAIHQGQRPDQLVHLFQLQHCYYLVTTGHSSFVHLKLIVSLTLLPTCPNLLDTS